MRTESARAARPWWTVPVAFGLGLLGGAVLGVLARLWMRLIADEPEFSWAGTLFIVIAFALFGAGQALSWSARRIAMRRRGSTVVRVVAAVLALPIFGGAGAIMLPTVLTGSLARWRKDWAVAVRVVVALLALPVVVFIAKEIVDAFGWTAHALAGVLGFLAVYGAVIAALGPTVAPLDDGWHMRRPVRAVLVVAICAIGAAAGLALRGA